MLAEIFMLRVEMATREAARGETRAGDTGGRRQVFVANGSGTKSVRNGRIYCIAGVGERTDRLPHWPRSPVRPYANDGPGGVAGPSPRNRSAQQIVVIHPGQNRIEGKTHIGRPIGRRANADNVGVDYVSSGVGIVPERATTVSGSNGKVVQVVVGPVRVII